MKTNDQTTAPHLPVVCSQLCEHGRNFFNDKSESCSLLDFDSQGTDGGALKPGDRHVNGAGGGGPVQEHPRLAVPLSFEAVGLWTAATERAILLDHAAQGGDLARPSLFTVRF